jgi:Asp-tRNA(Asn)/Glu-tRNA(Gln) amidotransferase C subunit
MEIARLMIEEVTQMMRNQPIFLKMDGATRLGSSFLAINAQFIHEAKVVIKTLAVQDSAGQHTAAATAAMVRAVMSKYELRKEQVLGIVTDNASSMVKCVDILNEVDVENDKEETDFIDASHEMDEAEDVENEAMASELGEQDGQMYLLRCAAHSLQLAVRDGVKGHPGSANVILKARAIAKKLRAPNMMASLKRRNALLPIIDVETRWGSTYMMLSRLLQLKAIIQDYAAAASELHASDRTWTSMESIAEVLELPYQVTVRLQSVELTPGAFLMEWCKLRKQLQTKGELYF